MAHALSLTGSSRTESPKEAITTQVFRAFRRECFGQLSFTPPRTMRLWRSHWRSGRCCLANAAALSTTGASSVKSIPITVPLWATFTPTAPVCEASSSVDSR